MSWDRIAFLAKLKKTFDLSSNFLSTFFVDTFVGRNALQRRSTQEGWPIRGPLVLGEREPVLVERAEEAQAEVGWPRRRPQDVLGG